MSKIEKILKTQKADTRKKAFIPFVTAGDPDIETSLEIVLKLAEFGSDVIELGVPFFRPDGGRPYDTAIIAEST